MVLFQYKVINYNFQREATMENNLNLIQSEKQKIKYVKPCTEKHEPVKIIQGSGSDGDPYYNGNCGYLYYVSLYYY